MMDEQAVIYLVFTCVVALLGVLTLNSYGAFGIAAAILSILTILFILVLNYMDFLIFPAFTSLLNVRILPAKSYVIPKSQNCIIKEVNGLYYATGYLTANIYNYIFSVEQVDEAEETKLAEGPEKWERLVMNVGFPFKFHMLAYAEDLQNFREELEGKRGFLEFQLSKEMQSDNPNQMTIDDFNKKINIIQARIDRLSSGERPVGSLMYIETIAVGVSEKAAMDALTGQVNQLQTVFNTFDLSITRVVGRELATLFGFGHFVPSTQADLEALFQRQT